MNPIRRTKAQLASPSELYDADVVIHPSGAFAWVGASFHLAETIVAHMYPGAGPGETCGGYSTSLDSFELSVRTVLLLDGADKLTATPQRNIIDLSNPQVREIAQRAGISSPKIDVMWVDSSEAISQPNDAVEYFVLDDGALYFAKESTFRRASPRFPSADLNIHSRISTQFHGINVTSYMRDRDSPEWPILKVIAR